MGKLVERLAPGGGDECACDDAAIPVVAGKRFQPNFLREGVSDVAAPYEGSASRVVHTLVVHDICVTAEVRPFFQQQEIVVAQQIGSRKSADATAHDHVV